MPNESSLNDLKTIRLSLRNMKAGELPPSAAKIIGELLAKAHELRAKFSGMTEFDGPYKVQEMKDCVRVFGPGIDMNIPHGFAKASKHNLHLSDRTLTFLYARERCIDLNVAYLKGSKGLKQ